VMSKLQRILGKALTLLLARIHEVRYNAAPRSFRHALPRAGMMGASRARLLFATAPLASFHVLELEFCHAVVQVRPARRLRAAVR